MSKLNVNEVAKMFDVSTATIYKKTKKLKDRLEGMTTKEKGVIFFSPEAVEIIRQAITTAPKETTLTTTPVFDLSPVVSRFGDMEKGILALTEAFKGEVKNLREDIGRLVEENRALRSEVSTLKKCLEYRKPEPSTHTAISTKLMNPRGGGTVPPIRTATLNPVRSLSLWESVQLYFDDVNGFLFGRG